MDQLTKREEQIMQIVWRLGRAFIRDIVEAWPDTPPPHYNTVATIVKILVSKGFLHSEKIGNTHQYLPSVSLESYREDHITDIKAKYFDNSLPKMLAHFAKKEELSEAEIEELLQIIQSKKTS